MWSVLSKGQPFRLECSQVLPGHRHCQEGWGEKQEGPRGLLSPCRRDLTVSACLG